MGPKSRLPQCPNRQVIPLVIAVIISAWLHFYSPQEQLPESNDDGGVLTIKVEEITEALLDAGRFNIVAEMLEANPHLFLGDARVEYGGNNTFKLHNHTCVTIFVPWDGANSFKEWRDLIRSPFNRQVVTSKIDEPKFDSGLLKEGSELHTLNPKYGLVLTGWGSINHSEVVHWNIYNDGGNVLVHGVDEFFGSAGNENDCGESNSDGVIIQVDQIRQALLDAGHFKIAAEILQANPSLFLGNADIEHGESNTILLHNHTKITVFVPWDKAISCKDWRLLTQNPFNLQVITSKVGKKKFSSGFLKEGSELLTLNPKHKLVVTGWGSINNTQVIHWDVYNDGQVIVHGVNEFFGSTSCYKDTGGGTFVLFFVLTLFILVPLGLIILRKSKFPDWKVFSFIV